MILRHARRRDGNSKELEARARAMGVQVEPFETRAGRPDAVWGGWGVTFLVEYKDPSTRYGRAGLAVDQARFALTWRGGPIRVVATPDDVDAVAREMKARGQALRAAWLEDAKMSWR